MMVHKTNINTAMKMNKKEARNLPILMLRTKSGDTYHFSRKKPGRWQKDGIRVTANRWHDMEIDRADVAETKVGENGNPSLLLKDGRTIDYVTLSVEKDKILISTGNRISKVIPYSEIAHIKVKRFNTVGTILLVGSIVAMVWASIDAMNHMFDDLEWDWEWR
jgi:hypothetical protein